MQVTNNAQRISFRGYHEDLSQCKHPDKLVANVFDESKPYLEKIGNSLNRKNLVIKLEEDSCDTFIRAFVSNMKDKEGKLVAEGNEHNLIDGTLHFVGKVIKGLEKHLSKEEYKNLTDRFLEIFHTIKIK